MQIRLLALGSLIATLPACFQFEITAQGGYGQLAVEGDIGYAGTQNAVNINQDVTRAFGLGQDQGTPYARLELDTGVPVLSVSGFMFEDEGSGVLEADFGANSDPNDPVNRFLVNGAAVNTELSLMNAKVAYAFEIPIGPVSISPGLAVDYFDLSITVQDSFGVSTQEVDLNGPIPLAFVRGEVDLGYVSAVVEGGYVAVDVEDIDASLLDIEAQLVVHPWSILELFVGYRHLEFEIGGDVDSDTFDTDFTISGLVFGGGLRF